MKYQISNIVIQISGRYSQQDIQCTGTSSVDIPELVRLLNRDPSIPQGCSEQIRFVGGDDILLLFFPYNDFL